MGTMNVQEPAESEAGVRCYGAKVTGGYYELPVGVWEQCLGFLQEQ